MPPRSEKGEPMVLTNKAKLEALRDKELARLKEALSRFNIFEAIGATHKELWHSDFLAYLLNPQQNHRLYDKFTERLLGYAIPELSNVDSWEDVSVRREYKHIDILIESKQKNISVIIENKIWSPEIPGQLACYWDTITREHWDSGWSTYGLFITPDGRKPMAEKDRGNYRSLSYRAIKDILDDILKAKDSSSYSDVERTIWHYSDMLGRFILGNTDEAEELARKLYFEYRSAVKLMDQCLEEADKEYAGRLDKRGWSTPL